MKKWNEAEFVELNINETAHNWIGLYSDGGYIGDGEVSGHLSWEKPEPRPCCEKCKQTPCVCPKDPEVDLAS